MVLRKGLFIGVIAGLVLPLLALLLGCNSGGGAPPPPTITSVTATCTPAQVQVGQTSQCSANVQGTGNFNPAVTWSVQGGSANGTINQNGLYTAPDPIPNPSTVTVMAVSQQDATKSGNAGVSLSYPAPLVTAASPSAVIVGSGDIMVTFSGSGFTHASVASFNGVQLTTGFSSFTQLTATIPASNLATAGTDKLSVSNPAPGGGVSPPITFAVNNPVPTLASVAPTSVLVGSGDQVVTTAGTNFVQGAVVDFNSTPLTTTFVSATQLTALLPGADLLSARVNNVTVVNPSPGGGASSTIKFEVDNPVPVVTSISPPSAAAGASGTTLTINGSNFVSTSTVTFNGAPHSATFVSSSRITMTLTAADQAKPGAYQVTATNPPPGGGTSPPILFSVYFPPSSTGSTAVLVETIPVPASSPAVVKTGSLSAAAGPTVIQTVDVAYVPMPSVGQVVAVNLDAAPTAAGSKQVTGAVVATIAMPTGYTPNFTAADAADNVVLVGSYSSNVIVEISIPPLDPTHPEVMGSYSLDAGSGVQFSGGKCVVCGLVVDDRLGRHYAIASTPNGYLIFNPLNGTSAVEGSFKVPPSENFAYDPVLQSVMNPNYQCFFFCGGGSLQVLDLKTMGVINSITNSVGSAPDSAAADPQTHLAAVPDEFSSIVYLLNFARTSLGPVAAWSLSQGLTTSAPEPSPDSAHLSRSPASTNALGGSTLAPVSAAGRGGDQATGTARAELPVYDPATLRAEREAWFMHGRQSSDNLPPAEHLLRALGQREHVPFVDWQRIRSGLGPSAAASPLPTTGTWTELGPRPLDTTGSTCGGAPCQDYGFVSGRVTSIAVDLVADASGNTVYVGTAYGGVWRSTNALSTDPNRPTTFVPIGDTMQRLSVGAIALNSFTSPTTIYVGTGEPNNSLDSYYGVGILRSIDDGKTWTRFASADSGQHRFYGLAFSKILVDPTFPNVVLAATTGAPASLTKGLTPQPTPGIYRSTDGGSTWSLVEGGASCTDLVYDPSSGVYYGAFSGSGIWKSLDHGTTWNQLPNSPNGFFRASLAARPGKVWALMSNSDGNPYAPLFSGLTGLSESDNGGQNWSSVSLPSGNALYSNQPNLFCEPGAETLLGTCSHAQGWYDITIAAPSDSVLIIGGLDLFFSASVSGTNTSWTNLTRSYSSTAGVVHADQHAIGVVDLQTWIVGNDGGAWGTTNSGSSWTDLNSTIGTIQFVSVSADGRNAGVYVGGAQDNGTSASTGSGSTWKRFYVGDGGYTAISPTDNTYFGEYVHVNLLRFDDQGSPPDNDTDARGALDTDNDPSILVDATTITDNRSAFYVPYELVPKSPGDLVLGTYRVWAGPASASGVLKNWAFVSPDLTLGGVIQALAVAPTSACVIYVGTSDGLVQVTGNASCTAPPSSVQNWTNVFTSPSGRPIGALAVSPNSPLTAYVGVQGFGNGGADNSGGQHVFKTTDEGSTWTDITGNLPDAPVNWILIDPQAPYQGIYVATDVGVFVATDGGVFNEFWQQLGSGLPNTAAMQLAITPSRMIIAATHGRGAWSIPALPGTPDFSLNLTPGTQAVNPMTPATLTAITSSLNGDSATITLTCTSPSTGCHPSSTSVTPGSSASFTVDASALVSGPNTVSIAATDGTDTHTATATVNVQDFSLSIVPSADTVPLGQSAVFDVQLSSATGYDNPVALACANPPSGISCQFDPQTVNSVSPQSILTVSTNSALVTAGSYTLTISGNNGSLTHTASLALTVNPAPGQVTLTVPSSSFQIGPGTNTCQGTGDWTMVAVELNSHALMVGQEFADCIAVAQLPATTVTDANGHPAAPPPPAALRFGEVPKDPDVNIWNNGGDPHGIAVFTSVVDGKAYGFVVEGSPGPFDPNGSPGGSPAWVARITLADFLAATASTTTGEVDPATMVKLITFISTK